MKIKNCAWCNKEFQPAPPKQKYCSKQCLKEFKRKYIREYMRKNFVKYKEKNLELCRLWRERHPDYTKEYYRKNNNEREKRNSKERKEYMRNYLKKYRYVIYAGLAKDLYDKITEKCMVKDCGFSITVDLHHIDKNKHNNNKSNLIGLCPSHHQLIHRHDYRLKRERDTWILTK